MTKEGSTKIVNFMTPRAGVLMLGLAIYNISHYSEYVLSSTLSIYSALIALVLRDYDAAYLFHCWFFYLCYDGVVDIQIWALVTRSRCKVSYTQVTVKVWGPLVTGNADLIFLRSNLYRFWTLAKIILCNSDETGFLFVCPSLMFGFAIRCVQHSQAMVERGVCELAHSFFQ